MTKSRSEITGNITVRLLNGADTEDALSLYRALTKGPKDVDPQSFAVVLNHDGTFVFGAELDGQIVSMVTLHILPNVTWGGRPYALIENVVTAQAHRGQGCARRVMQTVIEKAWAANCYKIMLLTSQARGAKGFYEAVGFNDDNKYGMIIRST
ncbi:MAG: GNAT family N-acetyltransferase [Boseongicola sp.]|nr:GNAT family N-acetyltransferase [Boseongicola sp.]